MHTSRNLKRAHVTQDLPGEFDTAVGLLLDFVSTGRERFRGLQTLLKPKLSGCEDMERRLEEMKICPQGSYG